MAYCRCSTDDFGCDLYCYEDVHGGWTTHVAGNKPVGDIPKVEWPVDRSATAVERFNSQYQAQLDWLKTAPRQPIGLPHDGETFNDPTREAFLERLLELRRVGYSFPDDVLDEVRAEIAGQERSDA